MFVELKSGMCIQCARYSGSQNAMLMFQMTL